MPWQRTQVDLKTACPRAACAESIGNGYLGGSRLLKNAWMSRKAGSSALRSSSALFAQQELHVRPDRAGVGAAVVVHRPLALQVPPGRGVHLGEVDRQRQRKRTNREIGVAQAQKHRGDLAGVVGPARRVEHERGKRRSLAVGDRQLEEKRLQVELGVPQADVALAADRAAVADHAIDLQAGLHAPGAQYPGAGPSAARRWERVRDAGRSDSETTAA